MSLRCRNQYFSAQQKYSKTFIKSKSFRDLFNILSYFSLTIISEFFLMRHELGQTHPNRRPHGELPQHSRQPLFGELARETHVFSALLHRRNKIGRKSPSTRNFRFE